MSRATPPLAWAGGGGPGPDERAGRPAGCAAAVPHSPQETTMRRPFVPLIALAFATFGLATPVHASAVSASAWSYETNDSHAGATTASAAISRQFPNAPGDSHGSASA